MAVVIKTDPFLPSIEERITKAIVSGFAAFSEKGKNSISDNFMPPHSAHDTIVFCLIQA